MRRFLMVGVLGALMFTACTAHAGVNWVAERVMFRTSGVADSATVSWGAAGKQGAHTAVTTAPISMDKWAPYGPGIGGATAADSVLFCRLEIFPTNATGQTPGPSSTDTIYVTPQVSVDGSSWINFGNPTRVFIAQDAGLVGNGPAYVLNGAGGTKQYWLNLRQLLSAKIFPFAPGIARSASTAPATCNIAGYTSIRFVVCGGVSTTGQFAARVYHWQQTPGEPLPCQTQVSFRTSSTSFFQGYQDSSVYSAAAYRPDTTAAVSIDGWLPFQSLLPNSNGSPVAVDTTGFIRLRVFPSPNNTITLGASADTMYCAAQVSMNGTDWIDVAMTGGTKFVASVDQSVAHNYEWGWGDAVGALAHTTIVTSNQNGALALNKNALFGFPLIRFIISNGNSATGQYIAKLDGFKVPTQVTQTSNY